MLFHQVLTPERTFCDVPGSSKKRVLENISKLMGESIDSLDAEEIFAGLIGRERLGSTGLGEGVAIPHCRLDNCSETFGSLIKLPEPIDFDAIDRQPVDLLFVLLVPAEATEAHLKTLASAAELFSQPAFRDQLRKAKNAKELYITALEFNQ